MKSFAIKRVLKAALLVGLGAGSLWLGRSASAWRVAQTPPGAPNPPAANSRYVGSQACAQCHQAIAAKHATSAMAQALTRPPDSQILRAQPQLSFRNGQWLYQITRAGDRVSYNLSDGVNTLTMPVLWAFGRGGAQGQTYMIRHEGVYYESRVSFFAQFKALEFTPGAPRNRPASLREAIGQRLSAQDTLACFGCHATVAPGAPRFQLDQFTPGVGCEACHGAGGQHITAMKSGRPAADSAIFNPRRMHPDEMSQQFCGACHRSWETVMQLPERGGMSNVRFQPYRITNSKCYKDPDDRRISCTACHDPHEDPRHNAAFYDTKCLACHQSAKGAVVAKERAAPPCPTGQAQCTACHMPKIEPPGVHFKFSDHHIRVVRANEPYPN